MLDECLDRRWTSKAHRMVQGGNAVLVGGVDVGPGLQQLQKPLPLVSWIRVAVGTYIEQFVFHLSNNYLYSFAHGQHLS